MDWCCYIIQNGRATYVGVSPDPMRRLRQHNGEICGGAKYTTSRGPGWKHICIVSGFDKISSLQFEWAVKHCAPRSSHGIQSRIDKLYRVLLKDKWTSKSVLSSTVPLTLTWYDSSFKNDLSPLPEYIKEEIIIEDDF